MQLNNDGVEIYYEVHGEGPVILLTHGLCATSRMWAGQIDVLSKAHKLVLWDLRGHGRSDYPEDQNAYTEAATVSDMAAILDSVGAETAIVGGLSVGGYMSLAFHRVHPERVRALLIIDTGPGFRNDEAREAWNAVSIQSAERLEKEGLAYLAARTAEMRTSHHRNAEGLAKASRGIATHKDPSVINSLPTITVPTLVLVGADDTGFINATNYMAAKIPDAEKVVIPNAGHAVNLDQPEVFNKTVVEFLTTANL
jgi:pimeloyl-ACP methyl ester carboxylesterase